MNHSHKILQVCPLPPVLAERLPEFGPVDVLSDAPDPAALLAERGGEYTVMVTSGTFGADAELIGKLPALQAICSLGVGYDPIDMNAANARNIVVSNTPDV